MFRPPAPSRARLAAALWMVPAVLALIFAGSLVPRPPARSAFDRAEDARLHAHFARVVADLAARPMPQLAPAARAERARLIAMLRDYDRIGRFPRNEGQSPQRTPIFVDRHGTRCAMAWLIERSGGRTLVARIAATANLARIHDLAGDAGLRRWLAGSGLDLAEAARIQPEYGPGGPPPLTVRDGREREDHFPDDPVMSAATSIAIVMGTPAIFLNLDAGRPRAERVQHAVFGILIGGESTAMGLTDLVHDGHLRPSGYTQLAIGVTALTLSLFDLREPPPRGLVARSARRAGVGLRPGMQGEPQLALALRF